MKPGYKTTEFWKALTTNLIGIAVTLGYFTPDQASQLTQAATAIAGGIISAASVLGYALSRGKAKSNV